jgi:glycosyltransferase involved in cell wall biosynthesis
MYSEVNILEWDSLSDIDKEKVNKITFPGTKKISDVTDRPTMAFAVMCKDEEEHIGKSLNAVKNYVDYIVVADNGSTDKTFDIVREFFETTGIPGAWCIDEWEGFGKTKTKMMAHVKGHTDYVIHLDADDFLEGNFEFTFADSGKDQYLIVNKKGGSRYWCSVIYDNKLTWKFCGVAHTTIKAVERPVHITTKNISEDIAWIDNSGQGSRILDPHKFLKDAKALEKQYWETLIHDPDMLNTRSCFYCAQSYKDHGNGIEKEYLVNALQWYKKYMKLRYTWFEEEYEAMLEITNIKRSLNTLPHLGYIFPIEEIEEDYLKAIKIIPDRAEAYLKLGSLYNDTKQFEKAYDILSKGKGVSLEAAKSKYKLFILEPMYELGFNDELSVACYWLGKKKEGIELIKEIIHLPNFAIHRDHYKSNLKHFEGLEDE